MSIIFYIFEVSFDRTKFKCMNTTQNPVGVYEVLFGIRYRRMWFRVIHCCICSSNFFQTISGFQRLHRKSAASLGSKSRDGLGDDSACPSHPPTLSMSAIERLVFGQPIAELQYVVPRISHQTFLAHVASCDTLQGESFLLYSNAITLS